jgi:hypothetical protein
MSYYNNVISLPVLLLVAAATGEGPRLPALLAALSTRGWAAVAASALLGFALSTSAFLVNTLVSATSMMVANNVNKFALIILSELFVEQTLGLLAALGTALVLLFAWLYSQSRGSWASAGPLANPRVRQALVAAVVTALLGLIGYRVFGGTSTALFHFARL